MRQAHKPRLLIDGVRVEAARSRIRGDELREFASDGPRRRRGLAHHQRAVVAQQVDRAALTEVDRLVDPLELIEVEDRLHDTGETSIARIQTPRHDDGGASLDLRDQRIAQNDAETWMVSVGDEIRAIRKGGSILRQLSRSKARYSVRVDDPDLAHQRQASRSSRQLGIHRTPGRWAVVLVPGHYAAQQQVGGLQGVSGLLRERLGQIAHLAVVGGDDMPVRTPRVVRGRGRERDDDQHADDDDPEPQARRTRCIREQ